MSNVERHDARMGQGFQRERLIQTAMTRHTRAGKHRRRRKPRPMLSTEDAANATRVCHRPAGSVFICVQEFISVSKKVCQRAREVDFQFDVTLLHPEDVESCGFVFLA